MKSSGFHLRFGRCAPWLLLAALLLPFTTRGAAFIKFDGVDGESLFAAYVGWSEIEAVSQMISREVDVETGSVRTGVNARFDSFICEKVLDKSSPKLAEAIARGKVFPLVEIHLTQNGAGGQVPYLIYELKNVVISSYSIRGHSSALTKDYESIGLNFEEITMRYNVRGVDGALQGVVEYNWNLETQTGE